MLYPYSALTIRKFSSSQQGFALITAILACVILFALAMLVIYLSTSDLRVSSKTVGEKKALNAAEVGVHRFIQNFDPTPATWEASGSIYEKETKVDTANDPHSYYTIGKPGAPASKIDSLSIPAFNIAGGKDWGLKPFDVTITGKNTNYDTEVRIDIGVGYGPVPKTPTLQ